MEPTLQMFKQLYGQVGFWDKIAKFWANLGSNRFLNQKDPAAVPPEKCEFPTLFRLGREIKVSGVYPESQRQVFRYPVLRSKPTRTAAWVSTSTGEKISISFSGRSSSEARSLSLESLGWSQRQLYKTQPLKGPRLIPLGVAAVGIQKSAWKGGGLALCFLHRLATRDQRGNEEDELGLQPSTVPWGFPIASPELWLS